MNQKLKTFFNWSTGKDAALALYHLQKDTRYEVAHLLTSVNTAYDRVSMHGIRRTLLEQQLKSLDIPSSTIELPAEPSMEVYESKMRSALEPLRADGFTTAAFGDIFLEDLRTYRENQLKQLDMQACFPIWKRDTTALVREFMDLGFKAIVVCTKSELLDASFVGRAFDEAFIHDLPPNVDPCGENGEFHTFCYDGPIFNTPVQFTLGEKTYQEYKAPKQDDVHENEKAMGFWFCDLLPVDSEQHTTKR